MFAAIGGDLYNVFVCFVYCCISGVACVSVRIVCVGVMLKISTLI